MRTDSELTRGLFPRRNGPVHVSGCPTFSGRDLTVNKRNGLGCLLPGGGAMVQWRLPDILEERNLTPYKVSEMARKKGYRLSVRKVSRLADPIGQVLRVDLDTLNILCRVLRLKPGQLLTYKPDKHPFGALVRRP